MKSGAVTTQRDLRTGRPFWLRHGNKHVPGRPLAADLTVDVAIVGAGVSGALIADALVRTGRSVAVLDRRGPVKGSTPASTALLQFEIDQPLLHLARKIGYRRAVRVYWRSATAVDFLRGRIADLGLRCGFRERQTVYLPGNVLNVSELKREAAARSAVGLRSRFIDADSLRALTGIERRGAVLSSGAGEVDPAAMVAGLWRSVLTRGARMYAPTEVVNIQNGRARVALATADGPVVHARYAVFATGYEVVKHVHPRGFKVQSTWAMATAPQPARLWPSRCLIWEAADPYLYLRTTLDGRVIVGGEDEEFSDEKKRDALIPSKIAAIRGKLKLLLPALDTTPDFAWAGCFGASASGLPAIGAIPGAARCFAVMGYGGNGITFSVIAAQIIQRAILGLPDPDAELFALPR
ncbi:MAG: FAD-binding oxidoreductase [Steroidobacteraceae bacterium]|nr:FAD-binding oxidoreductase [Steroidobacteraceae bacterium]MBP9130323.1 FAD-binding oxidoreductase [Steroidobacteraceae bacterium]